jgi:cell division protein FtsX
VKSLLENLNVYPAVRTVALMATIVGSAVGITWKVSSNVNDTLRELDIAVFAQATNTADIKENKSAIKENARAIKELEAFRHRQEGAANARP